ncbi:hypothetical protein B296_00004953 [Ensete ventricosum]|uniref:Inositol polyphosphate-related phosphatase domain-containing protein n=1 Tax=Ensete ventricosum TaxID=4639 RepID=A0A426ZIB6_ENSVE|nr:hypothetical protein B296_00004953 [Ensete ventricosum]
MGISDDPMKQDQQLKILSIISQAGTRAQESKASTCPSWRNPKGNLVVGWRSTGREIVPLNAGNVLVIEDNEPAAKWLALISHALNKPSDKQDDSSDTWNGAKLGKEGKSSSSHLFQKPSSLKAIGKNCRVDGALVKTCNCRPETASGIRRRARKLREFIDSTDSGSDEEYNCHPMSHVVSPEARPDANYSLVASKQMVGIFLSVWVRSEMVPHVGHLRVATVGRGIMGCLGNKVKFPGFAAMSLHRTSFCFVCSHLTSGEKEGDELKRNADVSEILKSTQFPRVCKIPGSRIPEKILEHEYEPYVANHVALNFPFLTELVRFHLLKSHTVARRLELPDCAELRRSKNTAGGQ